VIGEPLGKPTSRSLSSSSNCSRTPSGPATPGARHSSSPRNGRA